MVLKSRGVSNPLSCKIALCRASVKDAADQGEAGSLTLPDTVLPAEEAGSFSPRGAHDGRGQ